MKNAAHFRVAIVGAGSIVSSAHLPAYQKAGVPVAGILDIDKARAAQVASEFSLPRVYDDIDALIEDQSVRVVDIAVPPHAQETMVKRIMRSGRHVICQKPLATTSARAAEIVAAANEVGARLAVNVNMRWSPAVRLLHDMLHRQLFGQISDVSLRINFWDTWETWPWLRDVDHLMILYDAIHLIDAMRHLFGEAETVYATAARLPGHSVKGETNVRMLFRYPAGFTVSIHDSADNWAEDTYAEFRVEGDQGIARGILGVWYDYPVGRPDRVEFCSRNTPGQWTAHTPPGRWVPDAWAWTMAELFDAIEQDRQPLNSGEDHIRTLRYVEAAYASIESGNVVSLSNGD